MTPIVFSPDCWDAYYPYWTRREAIRWFEAADWKARLRRRTLEWGSYDSRKMQCRKKPLNQLQCKQMTLECQSDTDQGFRHDSIMRTCWARRVLGKFKPIYFLRLLLITLKGGFSKASYYIQLNWALIIPSSPELVWEFASQKFMRILVWYIN